MFISQTTRCAGRSIFHSINLSHESNPITDDHMFTFHVRYCMNRRSLCVAHECNPFHLGHSSWLQSRKSTQKMRKRRDWTTMPNWHNLVCVQRVSWSGATYAMRACRLLIWSAAAATAANKFRQNNNKFIDSDWMWGGRISVQCTNMR